MENIKLENRLYSLSELSILLRATSKEFKGQREYKEWTLEEKVKFMESICLNYPIPSFYIAKLSNGINTYMIDGQHRHKTYNYLIEELLPNFNEMKDELIEIYLERSGKNAFNFICRNKEKIVNKLITYCVNVTFIIFRKEDEIHVEGTAVFNYLNSTRNGMPAGNIVENALVCSNVQKEKINNITELFKTKLKYSDSKISNKTPLLDFVRSVYFGMQHEFVVNTTKNYNLETAVNKEINSSDDSLRKKLKVIIEKNHKFINNFLGHIFKEKIGLNKANKIENVVNSTYIYPILALSILKNKHNYVNLSQWGKYLEILDELLNLDTYSKYKSVVFGTINRTKTSITILEDIVNGDISSTTDFIDKYFSKDKE